MCGDSAGLITPLCGNGMAMAIHGAKLLSELILKSEILTKTEILIHERMQLENTYQKIWQKNFSRRLFWGRALQHIFGNPATTGTAIRCIHALPMLEKKLISFTYGKIRG
jgi:flavin-dependent dehydrogenase